VRPDATRPMPKILASRPRWPGGLNITEGSTAKGGWEMKGREVMGEGEEGSEGRENSPLCPPNRGKRSTPIHSTCGGVSTDSVLFVLHPY